MKKKLEDVEERKGWDSQYCLCFCEGVASRRPATPSEKHGLCPLLEFPGDAQHKGPLKFQRPEFKR